MAGKDDIIREDDGPGDDKGGQQDQQQQGRDETVLRPLDGLAPIRRDTERQAKPEYEIIEVDDNDQPLGGAEDRGGEGREEGNLSEEQGGERALLDERRQEGNRHGWRQETTRERRERKKRSREQVRTENVELRRELDAMRNELDQFKTGAEKRLNAADAGRVQADLTRLGNEIERQDATIATAENKQREALAANDADGFIAAQKAQQNAVIQKARLEAQQQTLKDRIESGRGTRDDGGDERRGTDRREQESDTRQRQEPRPLVGAAKRYLDEFQRNHDWIDANSRDAETRRDSRRVLFLDNEVYAEGYDPSTREYWDELENRMRDVLPHMFDEDDEEEERTTQRSRQQDNGRQQRGNGRANGNGAGNGNGRAPNNQQTQQRRGPPLADVGGRGGSGGRKTQVKISPERKRALIETGSLSPDGSRVVDPVKFERQLQRFAEFDAREGAGR